MIGLLVVVPGARAETVLLTSRRSTDDWLTDTSGNLGLHAGAYSGGDAVKALNEIEAYLYIYPGPSPTHFSA